MHNQRTFLFTAVILAMVSIANANLSLTVNGLDATKPPEIKGKENLIIAIAGQSDAKAQDISVICDMGKLEPLIRSNKPASREYLFTFADESEVSTVNLNVGKEIAYQLVLFYIPKTDTVIVFGLDKEALAPPQPKFEPEPEQQISISQTAEPEKGYFASMSAGRTTGIDRFPEPNSYPDLNNDKIVNFIDFAIFAENWQQSGSGLDGDFDNSGVVDTNDLATLAYFWLNGPHPLDVFDSFKAALVASDVNEAVTYFVDFVADGYRAIFNENIGELPNLADNMGNLSLESMDEGRVIYEISNSAGTKFYPVVFTLDDDGNWKIAIF